MIPSKQARIFEQDGVRLGELATLLASRRQIKRRSVAAAVAWLIDKAVQQDSELARRLAEFTPPQ
jgi:hypothetical protein